MAFPDEAKRKKKGIIYSPDFEDIITKLLIKNPNDRIGCKNGYKDMIEHPFFADIDFKALHDKRL